MMGKAGTPGGCSSTKVDALASAPKGAADLDGAADRWADSNLLRSIEEWIAAQLNKQLDQRVESLHVAQVRPWAMVMRVETSHETFWFKANAEGGAHEPELMRWLQRHGGGMVPETVAAAPDLGWWMAKDAGPTVADAAGPDPVPFETWRQVLVEYAGLQRDLHEPAVGAPPAGLPQCSPRDAPQALAEMLDDRKLLLVGDPRGLTESEHRQLLLLASEFTAWSEELTSEAIPLSIQHDDLTDANVCISSSGLTIIDWADCYVGHPFGSLIFPLRTFREQHRLPVHHPDVVALGDAYLQAWAGTSDIDQLRRIKDLAVRVAVVSKAHSWNRALRGFDRTEMNAYYASPESRWLRKLLSKELPY
ncbi:hypothetical protein AB0J13_31220 [Streptomyces anulatus]|uniref:phosphotransferase family protein n=1 Tax=Streptomyces anulatus TaxID=1892 RepID=UPI0034036829